MEVIKRISVALLALSVATVVSAAMYEPEEAGCSSEAVVLPCGEHYSAWNFAANYLWVQPSTDDLLYTDSIGSSIRNIRMPFNSSGVRIEASYHFLTGNDINLNWTHIFWRRTGHSISDQGALFDFTHAEARLKSDAVNLEFGQHFYFGQRIDYRFHVGYQYARVDMSTDTDRFVQASDIPVPAQRFKSEFSGFGPRVGIDASYILGQGFSLAGYAATSVLVGDIKVNNDIFNPTTGEFVLLPELSTRTIVPAAEGKLGIRYDYLTAYDGILSAEIGYQANSYFHTMRDAVSQNIVNYGYHGIYAGLKWLANT